MTDKQCCGRERLQASANTKEGSKRPGFVVTLLHFHFNSIENAKHKL